MRQGGQHGSFHGRRPQVRHPPAGAVAHAELARAPGDPGRARRGRGGLDRRGGRTARPEAACALLPPASPGARRSRAPRRRAPQREERRDSLRGSGAAHDDRVPPRVGRVRGGHREDPALDAAPDGARLPPRAAHPLVDRRGTEPQPLVQPHQGAPDGGAAEADQRAPRGRVRGAGGIAGPARGPAPRPDPGDRTARGGKGVTTVGARARAAGVSSLLLAAGIVGEGARSAAQERTVRDAAGREYAAAEGRVRVPENRAKPDGKTIAHAYVRVKSPAAEPGPPLVFLNGGPGQPATPIPDDPAALGGWSELLARADVVFLDQRGIGRSTPSLELAFDESLPEDFFLDGDAARRYFLEAERRAREHFQAQGVDLGAYNVIENADDVDALRAALGVEQVDLLGYSFGTVLATTVLRRHAAHVRRVVLVGTETAEEWGSLPTLLQTQIEKLSRLAAADPGVNHAVPDMARLLQEVLARLEREPLFVDVQDRRTGAQVALPLGRFGLEFLLRIDLGDGNDFPLFPALLWTLDQGRTDLVRALLEKRYNQLARGVSAMADTMRASYGPAPWLRARFAAEREACLLREVVNYFDLDLAEAWGVSASESLLEPLVCGVPALFVSGTLDCNAPPYQAEKLRYGFLDSTHLIVDWAGHEDLLPDPEVRRVIARFLAGEDVHAARVARPPPGFVAIRKRE